jgi:hypothetical protein
MRGDNPDPVDHPVADGVGFLTAAGRALANLLWPVRYRSVKGEAAPMSGDSEPVSCEPEDPATVFSPHPIDD